MTVTSSALTTGAFVAALILSGCSTAPPPSARSGWSAAPPSAPAAPLVSAVSPDQSTDITMYAMGLVGTPYRYGGNTPDTGFDCSGLIAHVYRTRGGVVPPRTVARLQSWGQPVPNDSVRTGDLVVFFERDTATHAGIYVGNGRFVHAPSTGGVVRLDRLDSAYWSQRLISFRRA